MTDGPLPNWQTMPKAERDRLLSEYHRQGLSASQIAATFQDATRNAVQGRIHRLKIGRGRPVAMNPRPVACSPKAQRVDPGALVRRIESRSRDAEIAPPAPRSFAPIAGVVPTHLIETGTTRCKWPVDGMHGKTGMSCGASTDFGDVYCLPHQRIAYVPRIPKEANRGTNPGR